MKKFFLLFVALTALMAAEAKVVKITLSDGTVRVFTSSELSAIDFLEDGTLQLTTYDGRQMEALDASFDEVEIGDQETLCSQQADTLRFEVDADGIPVDLNFERPIQKLNYVYPSVDPWGQPITLSGTILIPEEILSCQTPCDGILLFNHYTKFHRNQAPTVSNGDIESMFLANPLRPNYIIVESDFYGFGATVRFPQAFVQGTVNAHASLDGLLAARRLLSDMGIDYGELLFNMGYSSGGFDALCTQKLRDMEYADQVSFDKTFAGGSPNDVCEAYRQYVLTDSSAYNAVPLLLMVSTKETQKLDIDYSEVFQPYISGRIDELVNSKNYESWPVCDSIGREKKIHEILSAQYCDLTSERSLEMQGILKSFNLANDEWVPDTTQRIFIFHSRGDDYVPIQAARPVLPFLKERGFEPSIIPGRTRLQTNFVVRDMGHLSATIVYYVQSLAAIAAWKLMYTDGELNPAYKALVSTNLDPVVMMRQLDAMGIDCRAIITQVVAALSSTSDEQPMSREELFAKVVSALNKAGFTLEEINEMTEDSGVNMAKLIVDLMTYFSETPEPAEESAEEDDTQEETVEETSNARALRGLRRMAKALDTPATPQQAYEQQLRNWLKVY